MTTVETALGPVATADLGPTLMHEHIVTRSPGVHENWPHLFDRDAEDFGEFGRDLGVHPGNRREFSGPVGAFVRPGQPGGFVGFPLRGHAEHRSFHRSFEL